APVPATAASGAATPSLPSTCATTGAAPRRASSTATTIRADVGGLLRLILAPGAVHRQGVARQSACQTIRVRRSRLTLPNAAPHPTGLDGLTPGRPALHPTSSLHGTCEWSRWERRREGSPCERAAPRYPGAAAHVKRSCAPIERNATFCLTKVTRSPGQSTARRVTSVRRHGQPRRPRRPPRHRLSRPDADPGMARTRRPAIAPRKVRRLSVGARGHGARRMAFERVLGLHLPRVNCGRGAPPGLVRPLSAARTRLRLAAGPAPASRPAGPVREAGP